MLKGSETLRKLLILMVDDNMGFVQRMKGLLVENERIGHIDVASDYYEANRMVEADNPDIILLDINLPGKNGIEILKKIRMSENDCKVIMLTNHADDYYRQQCRELGADYFLDKTNDFGKVPDIISELC